MTKSKRNMKPIERIARGIAISSCKLKLRAKKDAYRSCPQYGKYKLLFLFVNWLMRGHVGGTNSFFTVAIHYGGFFDIGPKYSAYLGSVLSGAESELGDGSVLGAQTGFGDGDGLGDETGLGDGIGLGPETLRDGEGLGVETELRDGKGLCAETGLGDGDGLDAKIGMGDGEGLGDCEPNECQEQTQGVDQSYIDEFVRELSESEVNDGETENGGIDDSDDDLYEFEYDMEDEQVDDKMFSENVDIDAE
ncbi:Glycerol-3-phosphate dehydrogenase [NAD(P)+], partial [Striga asiatica]